MATITWRNLNAPQLETNFQDNSLKGFNDLFSGLAQQNQFAKEKERKDITENLKSSFFNYSGKEGSDALGTLVSSGQFGKMMSTLGDRADQNAVRESLVSTQNRLNQENQRVQLQTEKDRLLAQKPYVDAIDLLVSKGDLVGAKAYATGLSQQNVLDNDFAAKAFGSIVTADTAAQDRTSKLGFDKLRMDNALLEQNQLKQKQLEAQQVDQFTRSILTGVAPEAPQQLDAFPEFYGMSTPEYAAEAKKREIAISNNIAQTFGVPLNERGVLDTSKLSGAALDAYNNMYVSQLSNLQVPKPTSSISEKAQTARQDAVKARLQATLSNPATPKPIYDAAVKLAEQLEKTKLETNQQAINMRANALSIAEDQKKSVLGVAGLSGSTLGKNFDDVLKTLSSVGIKQDAQDPFLGSSKYDQFENIARVLTSDARFNEVDTGVVDKIIKKSFVEGGNNRFFDSDDDFSKIIKRELLSYVNSRKFYEDREFVKNTKGQTAKLTQELREARERDLRIKPK